MPVQLVPKVAVETLQEAIQHQIAARKSPPLAAIGLKRWLTPFDAAFLLPSRHGVRGQFGAVVADDHAGVARHVADPVQLSHEPDAGDRSVHNRYQAFPADADVGAGDAKPAAVSQRVRHDVA